MLANQALKIMIMPDEVARLALFLAAGDSSAITNQSYVIDADGFNKAVAYELGASELITMTGRLAAKRALVMGAGECIGRASAPRFAEEGARGAGNRYK